MVSSARKYPGKPPGGEQLQPASARTCGPRRYQLPAGEPGARTGGMCSARAAAADPPHLPLRSRLPPWRARRTTTAWRALPAPPRAGLRVLALPAPRLRLAAVAAAEGRRPRAPSPASSAPQPQPARPSPPPVRLPLLTFSCARLSRF